VYLLPANAKNQELALPNKFFEIKLDWPLQLAHLLT